MAMVRPPAVGPVLLVLLANLFWLALGARVDAADEPAAAGRDTNKKIYEALCESTSLEFIEVPLVDVAAYLSRLHNIPIRVDPEVVRSEGVFGKPSMTIKLVGVSLDSALALMLKSHQLAHVVRDGELLLTSRQRRFRPEDTAVVSVKVALLRREDQVLGELPQGATVTVTGVDKNRVGCQATIRGKQQVGWVNDQTLVSPSSPEALAALQKVRSTAEADIHRRLHERTYFVLHETRLWDVAEYLGELHRVKIISEYDAPVSGTVRGVPLWRAFRDILEPVRLAYSVRHETLLITKAEDQWEPGDTVVVEDEEVSLTWEDRVICRLSKGAQCTVLEAEPDKVLLFAETGGQRRLGWVHRDAIAPLIPPVENDDARADRLDPDDPATVLDLFRHGIVRLDDRGKVHTARIHSASDHHLMHLRNLDALRVISCGGGNVTDKGMSYMASFRDLTELRLTGASVTDLGLERINGLKKLRALCLGSTKITNAALSLLRENHPRLEELDLHDMAITDEGLRHLAGLGQLRKLDIGATNVTDAGVALMKENHPQLEELHVDRTAITDDGLKHLTDLGKLRKLDVGRTNVSDAGLNHLRSITQLQHLAVQRLKITDAGLSHLSALRELEELRLNYTSITDKGLPHLGQLTNLRDLDLQGASVTDDGLPHLRHLKNLRRLYLGGTSVTDGGLAHLHQLQNLKSLALPAERVTGQGAAGLQEYLPKCSIYRTRVGQAGILPVFPGR